MRRVLVVEGNRLVGIISTADLARASARKEGRLGEEVETVMEKVSEETGRAREPEPALRSAESRTPAFRPAFVRVSSSGPCYCRLNVFTINTAIHEEMLAGRQRV